MKGSQVQFLVRLWLKVVNVCERRMTMVLSSSGQISFRHPVILVITVALWGSSVLPAFACGTPNRTRRPSVMHKMIIQLKRLSVVSTRPFDEVVERLTATIGRPDMNTFYNAMAAAPKLADLEKVVEGATDPRI